MRTPKLLVVSGSNFLRAYAGIKYLCDSLIDRGIAVEVYAPIPRTSFRNLRLVGFPFTACSRPGMVVFRDYVFICSGSRFYCGG